MPKRTTNAWMDLGFDAWTLGWEAATVIGLRSAKIAMGGTEALRESELMVSEKLTATYELQIALMSGALGLNAATTTRRTLAHYRRKVRANARRLR